MPCNKAIGDKYNTYAAEKIQFNLCEFLKSIILSLLPKLYSQIV